MRRTHWPDLANRWLMWLVVLGGGGVLAMFAGRGDHRFYSSGELHMVHASFGNDCAQCHQPAGGGATNYFIPVSDAACLKCHAAAEHAPNQSAFSAQATIVVPGHAEPVRMAARCADCHVEHQGRHSNLRIVPDRMCVQCHEDLNVKGFEQRVERAEEPEELIVEESP